MKKYLSVFMLCTRSSLYKILLTLILMSGAQFFLFYRRFSDMISGEISDYGFSSLIYDSRIPFVLMAAFFLITIFLSVFGGDWKEKSSYTWRRLSLPEKDIFFIQAFYNSIAFFLLYGAEILTMFFIGQLYLKMAPADLISHQTLFINFYGNEFLHSLVPLEELTRWLRNLFFLVGLGFATAWNPYMQRRGKRQFITPVYAGLVTITFIGYFGAFHNDLMMSVTSFLFIIYTSYQVLKGEVAYEN